MKHHEFVQQILKLMRVRNLTIHDVAIAGGVSDGCAFRWLAGFAHPITAVKEAVIKNLKKLNKRQQPGVEAIAEVIYDAIPFPGSGDKPAWVEGGNSNIQVHCRHKAKIILEMWEPAR